MKYTLEQNAEFARKLNEELDARRREAAKEWPPEPPVDWCEVAGPPPVATGEDWGELRERSIG